MKELVAKLNKLGFTSIKTYIQSGNVVFQSAETDVTALSTKMRNAVKEISDFEPHIMILEEKSFLKTIAANPFRDKKSEKESENDGKSLHLFFYLKHRSI